MLSDAQLARAAQSGDAASLGVLLERHRAPLYALALRFLGYGPDAQEAVQDAFLTALRTIDRLREPEAVGGWLRGIQRNVCLRRLAQVGIHLSPRTCGRVLALNRELYTAWTNLAIKCATYRWSNDGRKSHLYETPNNS